MKSKTSATCRLFFGALLLGALGACENHSGQAVVLSKEHIDKAFPKAEMPTPAPGTSPIAQLEEEQPRPMRPDEIEVDGVVMRKEFRGTGLDPRAFSDEQWLVPVRMENGRRFTVHVQREQFERLKEGDRVRVDYRVGKYTGAVWSSKIVGK